MLSTGDPLVHRNNLPLGVGTARGLLPLGFLKHCWQKCAFFRLNVGLFRTTCELLWGKRQNKVKTGVIRLEAVLCVPSPWPRLVGPIPEGISRVAKVLSPSIPKGENKVNFL